ncbi:hypothetical protein K431DRAFT_293240 [Polychaeton citri CBS 116435]|uniref:Uncharacterized protein n=1 Tax=Polychaeton citri CBS 116435 TaxID=1314669 RepID=A0A9P4QD34_9PEZI|nr:hypothetical protein K431DRAFT_293240 [Polychaeton citri CBS 116435]
MLLLLLLLLLPLPPSAAACVEAIPSRPSPGHSLAALANRPCVQAAAHLRAHLRQVVVTASRILGSRDAQLNLGGRRQAAGMFTCDSPQPPTLQAAERSLYLCISLYLYLPLHRGIRRRTAGESVCEREPGDMRLLVRQSAPSHTRKHRQNSTHGVAEGPGGTGTAIDEHPFASPYPFPSLPFPSNLPATRTTCCAYAPRHMQRHSSSDALCRRGYTAPHGDQRAEAAISPRLAAAIGPAVVPNHPKAATLSLPLPLPRRKECIQGVPMIQWENSLQSHSDSTSQHRITAVTGHTPEPSICRRRRALEYSGMQPDGIRLSSGYPSTQPQATIPLGPPNVPNPPDRV